MSLRSLREKINLYLYDKKTTVLNVLGFLNAFVVLGSSALLVYYYGFDITLDESHTIFKIIEFSFGFYILRYLIRFLFDFNPRSFLKNNWFEGVLSLFLLVEGISYNFFGQLLIEPLFENLGFKDFSDFSIIFIQLVVFSVLIMGLLKKDRFSPWLKLHPAGLFTASILFMTLAGAGLLVLPEMTVAKGSMNFIDALFTSMSSVSVTGLTTVDISEALSYKGQIVVLTLIKLGGLNTIAFGALLLVVARFGVGIRHHEVVEDFLNRNSIIKTKSMLGKIILWATTIEIIGIIMLYVSFGNEGVFSDPQERLFQSVFHGISGFNNAGLSTLSGGMMHPDVIDNYIVHNIIMVLFFLGGFGMVYLFDLFEIGRLRDRLRNPWKTIDFGTKISLYFTIGLLLFGAVVFYIFEYNNTLENNSFFASITSALFESMTTRNAGFNVVDTAELTTPVLITFLFLMFIGASSGSAGGGIRTSTFAIMWASLVSTVRGKRHIELFKRSIPNDTVMKAYSIFLFFVIGNVVGPFALSITEAPLLAEGKFDFMDLVFEHVSAASTVGLSTGITQELSGAGKFILVVAMFIGRVGTLTLAYLLGKEVISRKYKYPEGHTMVG